MTHTTICESTVKIKNILNLIIAKLLTQPSVSQKQNLKNKPILNIIIANQLTQPTK